MVEDKYRTRQTLLLRVRNPNDQEAWAEFVETTINLQQEDNL